MRKQIFIINGVGGVGKDSFVSLVNKAFKYSKFNKSNNPVMNFSSVDKVKKIATMIGWNGDKTEKDRKFLSDLKFLTTNYNDMSFNSMKEKVNEFRSSDSTMLFLHIREVEEIEKARAEFDAKTILVIRDSVEHITSNVSDKDVFNYDYDIVIDNNGGMLKLHSKAATFVRDYVLDNLKAEY
jgi:hypothetical protein